ncbi:hypothetical protein [Gordonia soli]|uniref:Gp28/Gp37-like domain-containing protein n=1 Tax=Gordonia soli NBRC 108243 TaxID=1223545 RepID=M0QPV3_9ACTN|nr:hypothetical protein [Gordonia soli]GAC70720.1 hypothetical protein GS4_39_00510 [Gordonia soli NBRC 108243]
MAISRQRINKSGSQSIGSQSTAGYVQVTSWTSDASYPATITADELVVAGNGSATITLSYANTGGSFRKAALLLNGTVVAESPANSGSGTLTYTANLIAGDKIRHSIYNNAFASTTTVTAAGTSIDVNPTSQAYTGDATTTITATPVADGGKGTTGGASQTITATAIAGGLRATSSGATTVITATPTAAGIRGASSGAATTVVATAVADGSSGGSANTTVTVGTPADGVLTKTGGASTDVTVGSSADGRVDGSGNAATTITATPTAGGTAQHRSGAQTTVTATAAADGVVGEVGGASTTVTVTATADGKAGGSAKTTVTATAKADGTVRYADGHLDLSQADPVAAFAEADRRQDALMANPGLEVRVHDNKGYPLMPINDYLSATVGEKVRAVGTGTIELKGSDPAGPVGMTCKSTVVPITVRKQGYWKWTGRVDTCEKAVVKGVKTYTMQLVHDTNWLNKWMVFPTWWTPIQFQPIKEAVHVGPIITCIKTMLAEQQIRTYFGLWEIVNNLTNPAAWFASATANAQNGKPPYVIIPTNPLTDTSKWTTITARMDSVMSLIEQPMKDCGVVPKVWMWEPGEPQPAPWAFTLTEPTICFDFVDKTNVTGPTGTAIDGLIGAGVELADMALGGILEALLGIDPSSMNETDATNPYGGILSHYFGLDSKPPWPIYEDGPNSGITETHVVAHHPLAYTVIGGGQSPEWVNQGINLILEALLSMIIAAAAAATAGAAGAIGAIPNSLLDGVFDNIILAFQEIEHAGRRKKLGKFGYPEFFTSTGGTAYTLNELVALEAALWDSRGYYTFQLKTRDGGQYTYGRDYETGDPLSWIDPDDRVIYTDYLTEWQITDTRQDFEDLEITVGDGNALESPYAKFARQYEGLWSAIKAVTLVG